MMFVYTLCFVCFVELYVLRSCDVFCELHTLDAYWTIYNNYALIPYKTQVV